MENIHDGNKLDWLIHIVYYALFFRLLLLLLGLFSIATVALYIAVGAVFLMCIISFLNQILERKISIHLLWDCAYLILIVVFIATAALNTIGFSDAFQTTLSFAIVMWLLVFEEKTFFSNICLERYLSASFVISCVLSFCIFIPNFYKGNDLLLYTQNANQAGVLLMCFFCTNIVFIRLKKARGNRKFSFLFYYLIQLILFYGIYKTGSRSALITSVAAFLFFIIIFRKPKCIHTVTIVVMILFILYPFIHIYFMNNVSGTFSLLGKTIFSGRELIWNNIFDIILKKPFSSHAVEPVPTTGLAYYGSGLNAHNVWIDISWRYSLAGGICFIIVWYRFVFKAKKSIDVNDTVMIAVYAVILAGFIHMSFEAPLLGSAFDYSMYYLLPIILIKNNDAHKNTLHVD